VSETLILALSIGAGAAVAGLLIWKLRERCLP
jgi:hypothetical protein